jgi:hypothetical protein
MRTYLLHGLRVRSEAALDAPETDSAPHDVVISLGARRPVPDEPPLGRLLARLDLPVGSSSLGAHDGGYTLRIHSYCEFEIDSALGALRVHVPPDADDELPSLMAGSALAMLMTLRGICVLHASAVEVAGGVVAFVAGSGMGKTTVATLCCAEGARLVTDDVLRVEVADGQGWCFSGSRELRLRPAAAELARSLSRTGGRSTVDERLAARPAAVTESRLPLRAIVAPVCDHLSDTPRIERVRGADAVRELVSFPRTSGWVDNEVTRRDFGVLAELAQRVPIFNARLPWGPPFEPRLAQTLLTSVGLSLVE